MFVRGVGDQAWFPSWFQISKKNTCFDGVALILKLAYILNGYVV